MKLDKNNIIDQALSVCLKAFWIIVLFSFINSLLLLAVPIYTLQVFDRVISSGSVDTLVMLSIIMVFALLCWAILNASRQFIMIGVGEWLNKNISEKIFKRTITIAAQTGNSVSGQSHRDINEIKNFLTSQILISLLDAPWSVIFLIIIFLIHPAIGFITLGGGILLFLLAIINEKSSKGLIDSSNKHFLKIVKNAEMASRNSDAIEAMGINASNLWGDAAESGQKDQSKSSKRIALFSNISRFFRMVIQIMVTGTGAYLVLQHEMTPGGMIAGSILAGRALAPCDAAIGLWKNVISFSEAYGRLKKVAGVHLREEAMKLPEPEGQLTVRNATYVPLGAKKPIIYNVSFGLNPGDIVGVVGPSASGKTSLSKLLVGVWKATSGSVELDGADVYSWNRNDFGKFTGYLPQNIELFNYSIKDNISRLDPEADPEKIVEAAKIAGVHEMILKMPNGYDTIIQEGVLSEGQKQRIGIARAFYGDVKFVVLDEPNSNLDSEGEAELVKTIRYAKENKITTLIISHRTPILKEVDKMLVMKDGNSVMFGERDKVLEALKQQQVGNANGQ